MAHAIKAALILKGIAPLPHIIRQAEHLVLNEGMCPKQAARYLSH